jgi:hypothetical protein
VNTSLVAQEAARVNLLLLRPLNDGGLAVTSYSFDDRSEHVSEIDAANVLVEANKPAFYEVVVDGIHDAHTMSGYGCQRAW